MNIISLTCDSLQREALIKYNDIVHRTVCYAAAAAAAAASPAATTAVHGRCCWCLWVRSTRHDAAVSPTTWWVCTSVNGLMRCPLLYHLNSQTTDCPMLLLPAGGGMSGGPQGALTPHSAMHHGHGVMGGAAASNKKIPDWMREMLLKKKAEEAAAAGVNSKYPSRRSCCRLPRYMIADDLFFISHCLCLSLCQNLSSHSCPLSSQSRILSG